MYISALLSVIAVSLISLIGITTLSMKEKTVKKILLFLVSFAVGGLFGDAFIHLLPQSFAVLGSGLKTSVLVMLGILIFFVVEKLLRWRHCHDLSCQEHSFHLAGINLIGDAVHNFIDGLLIGISYTVSMPLGLATTLAIALHEIPQEIGDFGILLHAGLTRRKAIYYNFLTALFAILGTLVALFAGSRIENFAQNLLPLAAGGFIYLAGSDLIPELHREPKPLNALLQFIFIVTGMLVMAALTLLD